MEKSFDFGALLQKHQQQHKTRPTQFASVSGGVRKRLESNINCRKSSRLSIFDSIRNLPRCDSPKKQPESLTKEDHRRMQLEKWKEDKEKKKKQAAAQKKKPFIAGVAHAPLKFVPPPPLPKAIPSTSGRVTRSQVSKTGSIKSKPIKTTSYEGKTKSFAPKNATFKAPDMKNVAKVPTLATQSKMKKTKEAMTFDPVLPAALKLNSKAKPETQPRLAESKRKQTEKAITQSEKISTLRRPALAGSTSSSQVLHYVTGNQSPVSDESNTRNTGKHKLRQNPSEVVSSQVSGSLLPKTKTTKKPVHNSEYILSPVPEQLQQKSRTPKKSIHAKKSPIPKSESKSEEKLRSPKSPSEVPLTPEQIVEEAKKNSPFVTHSRGKSNARRELKKKIDEGMLDEDASDVDNVDHFRRQLNSEIKRMTEMCETWEKISEQIVLPETVQEAILGAVGQARLLMSHKLQQFAALVARCERPEPGQGLVTPADLHGFWDMVFMQVENVDMRFKKLEEMRARNWVEEAPAVTRKKNVPKAKPVAKPTAASRLRDVIAAARKAKKQDTQPQEPEVQPAKTFEAGFFCVRSPVRSPATPTGRARPSLLKAVLSSEAKKSATKNATAMLRASLIGKSVESDDPYDEECVPPTPINLHATPGRSILKPLNMPSAKKSGKKSIKVVLFDNSDAEATHDTTQKDECKVKDVHEVVNIEGVNLDCKVLLKDIAKEKEQKENKSRRKSLARQDATEESSPVMTRSRRKSLSTPALTNPEESEGKTPKRTSRRKKTLQEVEVNIIEEKSQSSKRSTRRKSILQAAVA